MGVGPAVPERARSPSPSPPTSPIPIPRGRGVGVGAGGFVGVGPGPTHNTASGTGFVGVGVGGGFLSVGGIPSPPEPSSPSSPDSMSGFGGGFGVGVGGGGFLSVAAPMSPPRNNARGVGAGGFLSVAAPSEPKPKKEKKKKVAKEEHKDELGDFVFDLHDLSLANIFVDAVDSSKITCIIDWESTTIRPLWQAAHLPTFLVSATHAHSHPVTPRMQSSRMSRGMSQADSRMSGHSDSRMSHAPSHRPLTGLGEHGAHLPPNGAASGMASIAALTAALNNYAQGVNETSRLDSPRWNTFDSPMGHHFEDHSPRIQHRHLGDSSPRFPHSPRHRYATLGDSPQFHSPDSHHDSAPRTAVLSRHHLQHSNSYPSPHMRGSGPNTAVNSVSALRPGGVSRSMSHRSDVHAHFEVSGEARDHHEERRREERESGGETPRRIPREEAAEWFKRIAAEIECPGDRKCHDGGKERCGERWTRAERERASWRIAHRAVEWDGWELGLVESVLEDARTLQGDLDF